jgi:hypothetical protein
MSRDLHSAPLTTKILEDGIKSGVFDIYLPSNICLLLVKKACTRASWSKSMCLRYARPIQVPSSFD